MYTSSSALDTATVFHQLVEFWKRLQWPDAPESYIIIHFLIQVMCYYTGYYARLKHDKLKAQGYFDTEDQFDISERLCVALNNIEHVLVKACLFSGHSNCRQTGSYYENIGF